MALPSAPRQRAFVRAVCRLAGQKPTRVGQAKPSVGGANLVWPVSTGAGPVVVKVRVDARAPIGHEAAALGLAKTVGAPHVLHAAEPAERMEQAAAEDPTLVDDLDLPLGGSLVLEALPGKAAPHDISSLCALAEQAARLHRLAPKGLPPVRTGAHPDAVMRLIDRLARQVGPFLDRPSEKALQKHWHDLQHPAEGRRWTKVTPKLCHGDLRLHNTVVTPAGMRLIDFEHAGAGDPALDLALFVVRSELTMQETVAFLEAYQAQHKQGRAIVDGVVEWLPLARMLSALAGADTLLAVRAGAPTRDGAGAYERVHRPRVEHDLASVLHRKVALPPDRKKPGKPRRGKRLLVVAVDGPAGSGSSTLVTAAAERFGLCHVNLGAGYRAAAFLAWSAGLSPTRAADRQRLAEILGKAKLRLDEGVAFVGKARWDKRLGLVDIERQVAAWAACAPARQWVNRAAAAAVKRGGVIVEGRVAGTVVAPDADVRVFVDADLPVRAARIRDRLGKTLPQKTVTAWCKKRDEQDRTRKLEPFVRASGSARLDTTDVGERASVAQLCRLIERGAKR